ncbi:MAG: primosomal replication protein [Colwellia sp.]|nr:primosomal replication protein [Colwellia sp.]MCW8864942.1 primosomal replication protein [Colwellia sp.]MCW9082889.1 primosomal replication protein [Colwellia sp.]
MNQIDRLSTLLKQLAVKAKQIDKKNAAEKVHRLIENNNLFSPELFVSQSDRFSPYIEEVQCKVSKLTHLLNSGKVEFSTLSLQKIEQQVSAISNALHANAALHQAAKLSFDAHSKVKIKKSKAQNKYKDIAKKLVLTSQQLYQKLSEHHDFERRLMDMVAERESQRIKCKAKDSAKISAEVLALHQRLGRCRKAISQIERDIELAEKRG